jgi:hypothetical protein
MAPLLTFIDDLELIAAKLRTLAAATVEIELQQYYVRLASGIDELIVHAEDDAAVLELLERCKRLAG